MICIVFFLSTLQHLTKTTRLRKRDQWLVNSCVSTRTVENEFTERCARHNTEGQSEQAMRKQSGREKDPKAIRRTETEPMSLFRIETGLPGGVMVPLSSNDTLHRRLDGPPSLSPRNRRQRSASSAATRLLGEEVFLRLETPNDLFLRVF